MIYTVIVDILDFCNFYNKRDCHIAWQPLSLIPDEIIKYIKSANSNEVKMERFAAYSALFIALKEFFGKTELVLERSEHGKPYLVENGVKSNIGISLSHSKGLAVISISDNFEIGVDIQAEINKDTALRLEKRFFEDVKIKSQKLDTKLFLLDAELKLQNIYEADNVKAEESKNESFTTKWAFSEAVIKCIGNGFLSASRVRELSPKTKTQIYEIKHKTNTYALVIAKKRL